MGRYLSVGLIFLLLLLTPVTAMGVGWFDSQHGQGTRGMELWEGLLDADLEIPPWFPIHYDVLAVKPLVVISQPTFPLFSSEIDDLEKYVTNGGILWLVNDWSNHNRGTTNISALLQRFGGDINNDILILHEEGRAAQRLYSRMMLGRDEVDVIVSGLDVDLSGLWFNDMGTLKVGPQWAIQGSVEGSIERWSLKENGDFAQPLELDETVIFAARTYGHGVVVVFSNSVNWDRPAAARLAQSLHHWAKAHAQPALLAQLERDQAFQAVFALQLAVEEVYWHRPTAHAAAMVEDAWTAYIDKDYQLTPSILASGWDQLEAPFHPLPPKALIIVLALILVTAGYSKDYLPKAYSPLFASVSVMVLLGVLGWLWLSIFSTGQFLDFLARVILLFVAYGIAIIVIPMDISKWLIRIVIFGLILSLAYLDALPDRQILDRVYLQENLIKPDSAPVQLIAREIQAKVDAGEVENVAVYLDHLLNKRLYYRDEKIDLHMSPVETLRYMEEDCDGYAILAASILEKLGHYSEVLINERHAWVETTTITSQRILAPQKHVLYAYDQEGYTRVSITDSIIVFIRKAYTGPIFFSFILAYWPKKFDRVFLADCFILFVLSLLIVSVPLRLVRIGPAFVHMVFPLYFFCLRLMLGWLKQTYQLKIRIVAAVTLLGSILFGTFTLVSLIAVMWGSGSYMWMIVAIVPLIGLLIMSSHGYFYNYIDSDIKLVKAVLRGKPLPSGQESEGI